MACRNDIYAEDTLEYFVGSYLGEDYIYSIYNPECYLAYDANQGIIYQKVQEATSEVIQKYGFSAIPNVYGLMSEEALEASGVLRIRRQPYLDLYGQNVLIGFVDSGIDYTHEAFIEADGTSRIVAIWDQTVLEGTGTDRYPYGEVYEQNRINEALKSENPQAIVPVKDEIGHGTFLAGVAAGNENRQEQFSGVAPLADIAVVKCKQAKQVYRTYYGIPESVPAYQENDIMAGISYLLSVATKRQQAVVVCIGMGTNMGNHNGDTNLGQFIGRNLLLSGVAFCVCAGNEGNARHHCRLQERNNTIDISVDRESKAFMAQLWWKTPNRLRIDVISPSGEVFGDVQAVSGMRRKYDFTPEGTTVELFFGVTTRTREQVVVFRFLSPKAGLWKIRVQKENLQTECSMWLPIRQFLESETVFLEPDPDMTITNPGTTPYALTVSAYDVRDGALYIQAGRGDALSGQWKPVIVSPGVEILGTYPRGRYGMMTGSSVSASFTAGIAALFMQYYGAEETNSVQISEIFIRGATPRGMISPNQEWGYGIADAYASITDY